MLKLTRNHEARQKYPVAMPRCELAPQATWDKQNMQHGRDMLPMLRMEHVQNTLEMGDTQNLHHIQDMQYVEH